MRQNPTTNSRLKNRKLILPVSLIGIALLSIGVYFKYSPSAANADTPQENKKSARHGFRHDDADKPVVVAIESASQGDYPVYLTGLGAVTALKTVTVHSRVDGELVKVAFTEGQHVKQGDLLAEIDPRPFQIQLQQAQGQLQRDEALLRNAEIDQTRYDTLLTQDSIASQQTTTQQALVKQYQGTVEMDKSLVNNAKLQLDYSRLSAPISGRVGLRQIDQGNIIHAGDANGLVVITQIQPINVVFTLPEDKVQPLIQRWRSNTPIVVSAFDRSGKIRLAQGKLTAIDNQIDPTTGTLKLKAQFDNDEGTLFANQFVNIKMHLHTLSGITLVSSAAIQHDSQGPYVFVVDRDKKALISHVTLGPGESDDSKVAVLSGLSANDAVVIEGIDRLKDGSQIDIAQKDDQAVAADPKHERKSHKQNP
jgi:multidrug efflux system membrane fusion protein